MKRNILIFFHPEKDVFIALSAFIVGILFNHIADFFVGTPVFHIFYQGIFALGICIFFPLWFIVIKNKRPLVVIGITANHWLKAVHVGIIIAALSVGGRIMNLQLIFPGTGLFLIIAACMLMATLFEEVFFRGFLQTRFEKSFGMIPAIVLSGLCFALYHSAQSFIGLDIRELSVLFCTGIFFSISFRITKNIITSYIVNLPQAILTFIGEPKFIAYSAHFNITSAVISLITTLIGLFLIIFINAKNKGSVKTEVK
jgi:uncharacterized protein